MNRAGRRALLEAEPRAVCPDCGTAVAAGRIFGCGPVVPGAYRVTCPGCHVELDLSVTVRVVLRAVLERPVPDAGPAQNRGGAHAR